MGGIDSLRVNTLLSQALPSCLIDECLWVRVLVSARISVLVSADMCKQLRQATAASKCKQVQASAGERRNNDA